VFYTTYFFLPYNAVVFLFVQNSCCYMSCVLYSKSVSISFVYVSIYSIVGNVKVSNKIMEMWSFMAGNNNSEVLLRSSGIVYTDNVYWLCGFEGALILYVRRQYICTIYTYQPTLWVLDCVINCPSFKNNLNDSVISGKLIVGQLVK